MSVDVAAVLSAYAGEEAPGADLPAEVVDKARWHVLDTVAAAVSGSVMRAGRQAQGYVRAQGGSPHASLWASDVVTAVPLAALGNAMAAHADETDDSHAPSLTHPGCSVVPAAMAVAEARGRSGMDLLRAVVLGYDVCGRVTRALWPDLFDTRRPRAHSTHAVGGLFGSAAAAGALLGLDPQRCRWLWSYAAQQASGIRTYFADGTHVEKAFAFAGMPALNGATVAMAVDSGWPGGDDPFTGTHNLFGLGSDPDPAALVDGLGVRYEILRTKLKKFSVGSPAQAPLEGLLSLMEAKRLTAADVTRVRVWLAPPRLRTVTDRPMPDVDLAYLLEAALLDGAMTFATAHDTERFARWRAGRRDPRIEMRPDEALGTSHAARVEVTTTAGDVLTRTVDAIPGSPEAPLTPGEVEAKATDLVGPVLGAERARRLLAALRGLADLPDIAPVVAALRTPPPDVQEESTQAAPRGGGVAPSQHDHERSGCACRR